MSVEAPLNRLGFEETNSEMEICMPGVNCKMLSGSTPVSQWGQQDREEERLWCNAGKTGFNGSPGGGGGSEAGFVLQNYPCLSSQFWPDSKPLHHFRLLDINARKRLIGYSCFPASLLGRNEHAKSTTARTGKGMRDISNNISNSFQYLLSTWYKPGPAQLSIWHVLTMPISGGLYYKV